MPDSRPNSSDPDVSCRVPDAPTRKLCRLPNNWYQISQAVRGATLCLYLALIALTLASTTGCSPGSLAFDGGHVPVGGGSRSTTIFGTAFVAENSSIPVPNATVYVTNTSITGAQRLQTTTTAKDGTFTIAGIPDAANVNNLYQVAVVPPTGSEVLPQQISFPVAAGANATVMVALPEATFDQTLPASITIKPATNQLHSGDTIQITAQLLDSGGNVLPVMPSLVFDGNFGIIQPDGLFTSTAVGSGTVTAYWNTGVAQLQSNASTITADTATPHQPPPPPVVSPVDTAVK